MKNYAVGYLNYFNNKMKVVKVTSPDLKSALITVLKGHGTNTDWPEIESMSVEQVKDLAFDMDIAINAIEI